MIFPVVSQALVEGAILVCGDIRRVTSPNRFRLVELLVGHLLLLDLLGLFLFLILFIVNLLNLGLLFIFLGLNLFLVFYFL